MGNHFLASSVLKSRKVMRPACLHAWMATIQTTLCWTVTSQPDSLISAVFYAPNQTWSLVKYWEMMLTCTHSRKKFRLKPVPLRTYLFVTVIRMLLPQ